MKRSMKVLIIVAAAVIILLLGGILLCRYIADYLTLDKNGMENPNYSTESGTDTSDEVFIVDGNYTYVDNEALLNVIAGSWSSEDGHYTLTLDKDCHTILMQDGETVLDGYIDFVYLQPGADRETEFDLEPRCFNSKNETGLCLISEFYHPPSNDTQLLLMEICHGAWLCTCGEVVAGEYCPKCQAEKPPAADADNEDAANEYYVETIQFKQT